MTEPTRSGGARRSNAATRAAAAVVLEEAGSRPPALIHPGWRAAFPWLVQGTTTRGAGPEPFDLGLFMEDADEDAVRARWHELVEWTGARVAGHARQVHGADVRVWCDEEADAHEVAGAKAVAGASDGATSRAVRLSEPCDGHATDRPGVVLAVTTADCVPVFVVDPARRAVAMLHAGWRGVAAGILERGLDAMAGAYRTRPEDVHVHFGPAICGSCYEVGAEVFEALDQPVPSRPTPIDLRAVLVSRALRSGVGPARTTVSAHCTRCTGSGLFSHRGGDPHRQVGFLGVRA